MEPILQSNLQDMGKVDIVVVAYVHGLKRFTSGRWEGGSGNEIFGWQKIRANSGVTVAFVGCRVSFWGDVAGHMIRALQTLKLAKTVIYVGKLGTLRPEIPPNQWLATGSTSIVDGKMVEWDNVLALHLAPTETVRHDNHYSLPSVLNETEAWLAEHQAVFDWVDPEIGHMTKASIDGGTNSGYLHIISDNIANKYAYDLSNECHVQVLQDRAMLVEITQDTLSNFFNEAAA